MIKILLYLIVTFLETGLGIWIFAQAFPKRKRMECRHQVSEWVLVTFEMLFSYSFSTYYLFQNNKKYVFDLVLFIYILFIPCYLLYKKRRWKEGEKGMVLLGLFVLSGILLTCQYWTSYESISMIFTANVHPPFFLFAFYACSFRQAYLWELFYLTNIGLIKAVYIIYMGIFGERYFEDFFYYPRNHTYGEMGYWLVVLIIIFLLVRYLPIKELIKRILNRYKTAVFMITLTELIIIAVLVNEGRGKAEEKNLAGILIIFTALVFALMVMLLRFLKKTEEGERKLFAVRNEAIEHQYQELSESYERYRHLVHDEKHILSYLKECLSEEKYAEALSFIESAQDSMTDKSKDFWTGITTLDFMLNIKKRKMDRLGIQFELNPGISEIPMEDSDFVVLLGNLLDNAIEAVEQCEPGNRKIWMGIQNANEMFLLRMKNTCAVMPNRKQGHFITSKSDTKEHGVGLESVKRIAEKYQGYVKFAYGQGYFEVTFLIT